jgi:hypothetical protein
MDEGAMFTSRSKSRQLRNVTLRWLGAVAGLLLIASGATAQQAAAPEAAAAAPAAAPATATPAAAASPQPSVTELKAQAFDAQEAARQADAAAADASAAAEAAQQAVGRATGVATGAATAAGVAAAAAASTPAPVVVPPPAPPAPEPAAAPPDPALEDLRRATEEAKNAAAAARAAIAALEEHVREREKRYSRNGFYVAGGIFFAPELFDTTLLVGDSRGAFGAIGYHLGERFDVEVRFDALDDFALTSRNGFAGSLNGWSATLNGRIFLMTKTFQPYIGMGLGAMGGRTNVTDLSTGETIRYEDTVPLFRLSGGFDFYFTESVALTADAAINMPGGELNAANYATLGGGLKFRF